MGGFLFGREGTTAENIIGNRSAAENQLRAQAEAASSAPVLDALRQYGSGEMSLEDALASVQDPNTQAQLRRQIATDPITGRQVAAGQITEEGPGAQLYGEEGLMQRLAQEEEGLRDPSAFRMGEDDYTAFGQAAGDITRQAGQREAELANILAQRGLSSSGAAGAAFSGLAGNKFEQLSRAQTNLAQKRVDSARRRLAENRAMQQSLGGQFESALQGTRGQNLQGAQFGLGQQQDSASSEMQNRMVQQQQKNEELMQRQATRKPGLFESLGEGIKGGIGQAGQMVGGAAGVGAIGQLPFLSDERVKEDVGSGSNVSDFFRDVDSVTFKYKKGDGSTKGGVMAQQVEQAGPIGQGMVQETPAGKAIDPASALSAILAELANQRKDIDRMG